MTAISGYPIPLEDVEQWRGDPLVLELSVQSVSDTKVALSGYGSAWSAMARTSVLDSAHIDFAVDVSMIDDPDDPHLILRLTGEQTAAMSAASYGFDVQATGGAETPFTVWRGKLLMDGEYTRA